MGHVTSGASKFSILIPLPDIGNKAWEITRPHGWRETLKWGFKGRGMDDGNREPVCLSQCCIFVSTCYRSTLGLRRVYCIPALSQQVDLEKANAFFSLRVAYCACPSRSIQTNSLRLFDVARSIDC